MNIDNRSFPEIDTSKIDSLNSPEEVRQETRRLLEEAARHLERKKLLASPEEYEGALEEYKEVARDFEIASEDKEMTHRELENLREQVSHVEAGTGGLIEEASELPAEKLAAAKQWAVEKMSEGIISFNEYLVSEGVDGFNSAMDGLSELMETEYGVFGLSLSAKDIIGPGLWVEVMSKLDVLRASPENINTKLFRLSDIIHDLGEAVYSLFPWMEGNMFEQAHNKATEGIIKNILNSGDKVAIKYDKKQGYSVKDSSSFAEEIRIHHYDISYMSDTEIGTYLCSLNSAGMGAEESMNHLLDVFGHFNLIKILNKSNNCSFGGESFSGANWPDFYKPYLDGFSEKMIDISVLFFNSGPVKNVTDTLNASSGLPETTQVLKKCDLCDRIKDFGLDEINSISPEAWEILKEEQADFVDGLLDKKEVLEKRETVLQSFENYYLNAGISQNKFEEVRPELESLIDGMKEDSCSISYIKKIKDFNTRHFPENTSLSLSEADARHIISSVIELRKTENELRKANLRDELASEIQGLTADKIEGIFAISNQIERNDALLSLLDSIENQETKQQLEVELRDIFEIADDIKDQEARTEILVKDAGRIYEMSPEEILEYMDYLRNRYGNLKETLDKLTAEYPEEHREKFRKALEIYFGHSYTFDEILEKPETRLAKITEKNLLKDLLVAHNDDPRLIKAHFRNLPSSLRNDRDIALAFPGKITERDFPFLYPSLLADHSFMRGLMIKSINRQEDNVGVPISSFPLLLQKYCASGGNTREMVSVLAKIFDSYPEIKDQIGKNIPFTILNSDNEGILGLEAAPLKLDRKTILTILNGFGEIQNPQEASSRVVIFKQIDKFLEQNSNEDEIKQLLIEKGGLFHTSYVKSNLGRSSVIWSTIIEHDKGGIRFLAEGTLKDPYFQEQFVNSLSKEEAFGYGNDNEVSLGYLVQYIPLEGPEEIYKFFSLLQKKFPDQLSGEQIYTHIGNDERFRNTISAYFEVHGTQGLSPEASIFVQKCIEKSAIFMMQIEDSQEAYSENAEKGDINLLRDYFKQALLQKYPQLNEADFKTVLSIIENAKGLPLEEGAADIMRIFGDEAEGFIKFVLKENQKFAQLTQEQASNKPRNASEYSEIFAKTYIDPETGKFIKEKLIGIGEVDKGLYGLVLASYISTSDDMNQEEFQDFSVQYLIEKLGLTQEQALSIYKNYFATQYSHDISKGALNDQEYIKAYLSGNAPEYLNNLRNSYSDDIVEHYAGASLGENGEVIHPPKDDTTTLPLIPIRPEESELYRETIAELNLTSDEAETLTVSELETLSHSQEARENFVDFKDKLDELNLDGIWKFRHGIFAAIGSMDFRVNDGNYIGENELNIFLTKVMYATTGDNKYRGIPTNYGEIRDKIFVDNKLGPIGGQQDVTNIGEGGGIIETQFRDKFAPRDAGVIEFKIGAFKEALSGNH